MRYSNRSGWRAYVPGAAFILMGLLIAAFPVLLALLVASVLVLAGLLLAVGAYHLSKLERGRREAGLDEDYDGRGWYTGRRGFTIRF